MSQDTGKGKERGKAKGKKLTVKKETAIKDLAPKQDVRAGAAMRTPVSRLASNHNQTLVLDQLRGRV